MSHTPDAMISPAPEFIRYVANGLVATFVHYCVLTLNIEVFRFESAALANLIAACVGISASYVGNRLFVFKKTDESPLRQGSKFVVLYAAIAMLHGLILLVWTDWLGFDYRIGFLIATGFQFASSYVGNKLLVFR
ncbi:MAG: GtrA family protein [Proteobacteria bacterium]|nr:GtrA family protein [Pseudomonadota bacterium]MDA1302139.1 GtrA family protein [Pseudomonadota bacterium]